MGGKGGGKGGGGGGGVIEGRFSFVKFTIF